MQEAPVMTLTLPKIRGCYYVYLQNFISRKDAVMFQFDTGALVSLVGLNSICGENSEDCLRLKGIVERHIREKAIEKLRGSLRTVTEETVEAYPCCCHGVSVAGAKPVDFYFHICLNRISFPLLGMDYIDDCSFYHAIAGTVEINAIADNPGKRFYDGNVLDFDEILSEFFGNK